MIHHRSRMNILILNAGSSTLKYALFGGDDLDELDAGTLQIKGVLSNHRAATEQVLQRLASEGGLPGPADIQAVGHRVVHGGEAFRVPTLIDARVKAAIGKLSDLAPLHNPPALAAIEAAESAFPDIPQVAVFDTAFFADLSATAHVYPLPYEWYVDWGIRRFGFHGISHAYCAGRAAEILDRPIEKLRLVTCHLGNGCSATAVQSGKAVATTMGFTPMEGLMMGTRSGSVDPGILFHLMTHRGIRAEQLESALNREAGLLGISGVSSDFREVQSAARGGNHRAKLAIDLFADRIRSSVGSLAVTMGGVDALIFTAGIGENSPELRGTICERLECLGLHLDAQKNQNRKPDADLALTESSGRILAIHTREDYQIACEARRLV